jgi:hypothetical protein
MMLAETTRFVPIDPGMQRPFQLERMMRNGFWLCNKSTRLGQQRRLLASGARRRRRRRLGRRRPSIARFCQSAPSPDSNHFHPIILGYLPSVPDWLQSPLLATLALH